MHSHDGHVPSDSTSLLTPASCLHVHLRSNARDGTANLLLRRENGSRKILYFFMDFSDAFARASTERC